MKISAWRRARRWHVEALPLEFRTMHNLVAGALVYLAHTVADLLPLIIAGYVAAIYAQRRRARDDAESRRALAALAPADTDARSRIEDQWRRRAHRIDGRVVLVFVAALAVISAVYVLPLH